MEVAIRRTEVRSEEISGATAHSQEGAVPPKTGFHDAFVPLVPRESGTGVTRYPAGAQNLAARILCRERSSTTAKGAPSGSSRSLLGALAAADSRTLAPQFSGNAVRGTRPAAGGRRILGDGGLPPGGRPASEKVA